MTAKPNTPGQGASDETLKPAAANDSASPVDLETPEDTSGAEAPDRVAQLEAEKIDLKEKLLRTLADMENLRRRTEREVTDARTYAVANFARDVLDIADNLQRALDAVPAEAKAAADPGLKALIEGVELTERSLLNTLEKNGVKKFDPTGERFDPNFQQAMYEVPDASVPAGTVVQVVQTGYKIGERILRPALVGVSKGGARPAPAEQASPNSDDA